MSDNLSKDCEPTELNKFLEDFGKELSAEDQMNERERSKGIFIPPKSTQKRKRKEKPEKCKPTKKLKTNQQQKNPSKR